MLGVRYEFSLRLSRWSVLQERRELLRVLKAEDTMTRRKCQTKKVEGFWEEIGGGIDAA